MGSFIILVINLTIIKDDDVGNVQKFECLCGYSRHLHTRGNKIQPEIVDFKYHNLSGYIFTSVSTFLIPEICYCLRYVKEGQDLLFRAM